MLSNSDKTIGYKIANVDNKRVLITLEISNDANTNFNRKDIIDKEYAKYRCDKALVISIEDNEGNKYKSAFSCIYDKKTIEYKVGEKVEESDYNKDIELVCGEGIHFFLNKEIALLYGLNKVKNGEYKKWYDNGQLKFQINYVEGKINGEFKEWYYNGQLSLQTHYEDGKIHGEYKEWFADGRLYVQTNYIEDQCFGKFEKWYDNGQLYIQLNYVEDKRHGEYKKWWKNGKIKIQTYYVEGKKHGEYKKWNKEEKLINTTSYKDGIKVI